MKLPSIKKLPLVPVLVAIFLATGLILFVNAFSKKEAFSQFNLWGGRETTIESQNKDSDNDGLKDWEEDLYKTDYLNPDTDGDGYLDGEEINSDHNPLVKGPNDKQIFYPLPLGKKYNITERVLSEEAMQALINSYLSQKKEYLENHPEIDDSNEFLSLVKQSAIEEMARRAFSDIYPILLEKASDILSEIPEIFNITIADGDIEISDDNSQKAIDAYTTKIFSIISSDDFILKAENFNILLNSFESGDFSKLDNIIKSADIKIGQLRESIVPSSWKETHKEILGLTILTRNVFVSLRDVENDFLKAYFALQELNNLPDKWDKLLNKILETSK